MIGISSLDLLAFPHRRSDRVVVPVVDARKGEVFYAMYRQVPGGLQQVVEPRVGPVDELVADLLARSQEALCVGDGAQRYRAEILDGFHCEIADESHPSAGPLVQLAHARALREEWVSPADIRPVYLRQPDAQINWSDPGRAVSERASQPSEPRCVTCAGVGSEAPMSVLAGSSTGRPAASRSSRCAAATSARSWPSSGCRTRARGRRRCSTTSSTRSRTGHRHYLVARLGRTVVGYAGLMFVADEAHVTNVAVHPDHRRSGIATQLLLELADVAIQRGCAAWTLEVRASSTGAQALYRAVRVRAGRRAGEVLREHRGRHRDVVPRHPGAGLRRAPGRAARR